LQFAATGWPAPTDGERCAAVTLKGKRCGHRRARSSALCQQHERRISSSKPVDLIDVGTHNG
jgi:hypothetical protein